MGWTRMSSSGLGRRLHQVDGRDDSCTRRTRCPLDSVSSRSASKPRSYGPDYAARGRPSDRFSPIIQTGRTDSSRITPTYTNASRYPSMLPWLDTIAVT